ncbi:MAG TPA: hypothetical protein DCM02_04715 [Flavobacterium sp.]|nr:hypothetical protein [Flavobacterium sp.]
MHPEIEKKIAQKLFGHNEQSWKRASGETQKHYLDLAKFEINLVKTELAKEQNNVEETDLTSLFKEEIESKNSEIENLNKELETLKAESEKAIAELVAKVNALTAQIEELKKENTESTEKKTKK